MIKILQRHHLLIKSLLVSLFIHLGVCFYFYTHPFLLRSSLLSLFRFSSAKPETLVMEEESGERENHLLEEVFEKMTISSHALNPLDRVSLIEGIAKAPQSEEDLKLPIFPTEEVASLIQLAKQELLEPSVPLSEEEVREVIAILPFSPPPLSAPFAKSVLRDPCSIRLPGNQELEPLKQELFSMPAFSEEAPYVPVDHQKLIVDTTALLSLKLEKESALKTTVDFSEKKELSLPLPEALAAVPKAIPLSKKSSRLKEIQEYALPPLAVAKTWRNFFDVDLHFTPNREGSGYLFSIDITPRLQAHENSLKQNFYFLLDRSHSIQKHKFAVFKRAILKAISSMQEGESFNIYFLDKKGTKLSKDPLAYSMNALRAAEEFLDKQEVGTPFVPSNIYTALDSLLQDIKKNHEVNTVILLTDGHSSLKPAEEQKALKKWISTNQGNLSVYTAAVGQKNNLVFLDLLSHASGGALLYSDTHAAFPRKLAKLILDLHDPILSEISLSVLPTDENAKMTLSTESLQPANFHSHRPYQIIGMIDEPCDFELVLQGRNHNEWITIEETISFSEGEENFKPEPEKDLFQMHLLYAKFLREGGVKPLKDVKAILQKSHDAAAFE